MLLDDYGNSTDHFTLKFNKEHSNNHKIDMSNFTNGLYYVKVGNITKTFIVNK